MPLFYVHPRGPAYRRPDDIGIGRDTLKAVDLNMCDAIAAELMREGRDAQQHTFEMSDAAGTAPIQVPFSDRDPHARERPRLPTVRQTGRTADLAASIHAQIEILRATMRATPRWLEQRRDVRAAR